MEKISVGKNLSLSRIVHGHWRLSEWGYTGEEFLKFIKECIELGITSIDTADIYGNYSCEELFGNAISMDRSVRNNLQIVTKCGISLISDKFPKRNQKTYNYSFDYVVEAVNRSLIKMNTDYIDLLLLHRPSPLLAPDEVARAFDHLEKEGKVLNFGVSNFNQIQYQTLQSYTSQNLVTNQVEISPLHLEHFDNGNVDFFLKDRIKPMAWSPLARGRIFSPETEKELRVFNTIKEVGNEIGTESLDQIIIAWLLKHPVRIIPIIGSGKMERIRTIVDALDISLTDEQWFRIYVASVGEDLP